MNKLIALLLAAAAVFIALKYTAPNYKDISGSIVHPYALSISEQEGKARALLTDEEKQLYDALKSSLLKYDKEFLVRRNVYNDDSLRRVLWCVMQDSPDIFWIDWKSWEITQQTNGFLMKATYIFEPDAIEIKKAELETAIDTAVTAVNDSGAKTDLERALFVHNYLIELCSYKLDGPFTIHSPYGALVEKQAVCDGYAFAYQLITEKLGMECYYIEGTTVGNNTDYGHAWNIISVDGVYYQLDVTWDDIEPQMEEGWSHAVPMSYCYFLLSDAEMALDHIPDNPLPLPQCSASYDYFGKQSLSSASFKDISGSVADSLFNNILDGKYYVEFKITDPDEYKNVLSSYDYAIGGVISDVNARFKAGKYTPRIETKFLTFCSDTYGTIVVTFFPAS